MTRAPKPRCIALKPNGEQCRNTQTWKPLCGAHFHLVYWQNKPVTTVNDTLTADDVTPPQPV